MNNNFSISEENYLKAIFDLQSENGTVTTNELAEKLKAKPASITDMMKKLSSKKLLHYKPYYGFSLTAEGRKTALYVIRRHRLWEFFLSEKLGFGWEEVHNVAEDLEHVSSKKLIDRLDEYLGFPAFDPHGDPIPDSKGKIAVADLINLTALPPNIEAVVVNVRNQSEQLLQELATKNITIGTALQVKKTSGFDGSMLVKLKRKNLTLTYELAQHLFVKKVKA